jgi:hypothetical protein
LWRNAWKRKRIVISYATDRSVSIVTTREIIIMVETTNHLHDNRTLRLGVPYSVAKKDCLKGMADWAYTESKESSAWSQKTEVKIRLPGRAVRNTELRRQSLWFMCCKVVKWIIVATTGKVQNRVTKSGIH